MSMLPPFGQFGPFSPPGSPGIPGPPSGPQTPPGQGQAQAPTAPPPQFVPQQPSASLLAVDPGSIVGCLFRNTFIWPTHGPGFWFYPIFVGRTSISGFRWNGFFWMFSGFDLRNINSFTCF